MNRSKYKEPVDLIQCDQGVCTVIHPDTGMVVDYCVRGLHRYAKEHVVQYTALVNTGILNHTAYNLTELPSQWDVRFERPDIMGKALTKVGDYVSEAKERGIIR